MIKDVTEIIKNLDRYNHYPKNILDIGCYGLDGKGGSGQIIDSYYDTSNITGVNWEDKRNGQFPKIKFHKMNFFDFKSDEQFDFIFCDLGWEGQLQVIENDLKNKLYDMLSPGGFVLFYVFVTNEYGPEDGHKGIREHLLNEWGWFTTEGKVTIGHLWDRLSSKYNYQLISVDYEHRDYIAWALMKKRL